MNETTPKILKSLKSANCLSPEERTYLYNTMLKTQPEETDLYKLKVILVTYDKYDVRNKLVFNVSDISVLLMPSEVSDVENQLKENPCAFLDNIQTTSDTSSIYEYKFPILSIEKV